MEGETGMTDEQIETMLKMHRYLISNEIKYAFDVVGQTNRASALQKQINDEEWDKFYRWLRMIRDE
jgi:hypothetical protein